MPSTSVQNSTFLAPRQEPTMAAEKSEPLRPKRPGIDLVSANFARQEQMKPGNSRIRA